MRLTIESTTLSIPTDDSTPTSMTEDAAVAALMDSFDAGPKGPAAKDVRKPAPEDAADSVDDDVDTAAEATEDGDDDDPENGANDGDQDDGDDDPDANDDEGPDDQSGAAKEAADDQVVKVSLDGETKEFTVASLKRLAGQEAALTRKSQEADLVGGRAAAALQAALEATMEDLQPYREVDWMTLQSEMDPEEFKWHRQNATRAEKRYQALVQQAQGFEEVMQQRKQADNTRRAQEAVKVLSDPATGIEGWGDKLYGEILDFGISQGLDENDVVNIVDPTVIKLLHKAMLHDRGAKAVAEKVKAAPTKALKAGNRDAAASSPSLKKVEQRLARSGSDEDAVALLKGRWG